MNADNRQQIIDTFINSIYVYDDKMVVNFNCREDSETIPLKLMKIGSDLEILGAPNKTNPNSPKCSDLFVFYPNKPVFGLVLMY